MYTLSSRVIVARSVNEREEKQLGTLPEIVSHAFDTHSRCIVTAFEQNRMGTVSFDTRFIFCRMFERSRSSSDSNSSWIGYRRRAVQKGFWDIAKRSSLVRDLTNVKLYRELELKGVLGDDAEKRKKMDCAWLVATAVVRHRLDLTSSRRERVDGERDGAFIVIRIPQRKKVHKKDEMRSGQSLMRKVGTGELQQ